jgi:tripartite ATP-independent transporter DctM subunit
MAFAMVAFGIFKGRGITRSTFSARELAFSAKDGFAEILLPVGIGAGYFSGFLSLIETAAFAALYSFVLEVFIRKDYTLRAAARTILSSVPVAGGVLVIIGAAKGLAFFLIDAGVPFMLTEFVMTFVESKYLFLFLLNLLLLVVGCLMDLYSAILVVSPLIMPVAESFGIHPVHTGVIFLTNLALGFLTPPVGMNLFIASYTFNKPIVRIVRNILPYLAIQFFILMLVTYVPAFSLALI